MNKPLKLIKVGNSTGVILPKDELRRMGLAQGDQVQLMRTCNGIELRAEDADFDRQMAAARDVMHRRKMALKKLAE